MVMNWAPWCFVLAACSCSRASVPVESAFAVSPYDPGAIDIFRARVAMFFLLSTASRRHSGGGGLFDKDGKLETYSMAQGHPDVSRKGYQHCGHTSSSQLSIQAFQNNLLP